MREELLRIVYWNPETAQQGRILSIWFLIALDALQHVPWLGSKELSENDGSYGANRLHAAYIAEDGDDRDLNASDTTWPQECGCD